MDHVRATLGAVCLAALLHPSVSLAQSPDAESIIKELRPTASQVTGPTRGIRPASPATEPAMSHAAAAPAEAPSVKLMVDFRTGSADLTPAAEHTLDQLGKALTDSSLQSYRFRVEGHTDTVGTPEANKALATKRAEAVADYLEKKFSIDASRLDPEGLGASQLLVPTPDQTAEPRNRVVRVVNLGT
jgi:outer membrane protein OmpA-like peptidoglycan-associated protein